MRYLHLDTAVRAVSDYLTYRAKATTCFFAGPRLGHSWKGMGGLYDECSHCEKTFVGNL